MVAQPSCHRLPSVKFHTSLEVATAHGLFRTLHKSTTGSRTILAPPGLAPLVLLFLMFVARVSTYGDTLCNI
jgi:hypothetical protein